MKLLNPIFLILLSGPVLADTQLAMQFGATPFPNPQIRMNAQNCGTVDLTSQMGPVHEQTAGTCYAYAALDIMNFGTAERYSPLHLATLKTFKVPDKNAPRCPGEPEVKLNTLDWVGGFTGGFMNDTIKLGMEKGLCPETLVRATDGSLKHDYDKIIRYYHDISTPQGLILANCDTSNGEMNFSKEIRDRVREKGLGFRLDRSSEELSRMFPGVSPQRANSIANSSLSVDELFKRLGDESCRNSLKKDVPPGKTEANIMNVHNLEKKNCINYYTEENRAKMLDLVNKSLDNNKPAGMSYVTGGLIQSPAPKSHGFHASVISGRYWDERSKSCQYVVKNSWGEDWKVKAGLKAKTDRKHPGYFIVTEKQLMEHLYGATTID